MGIEPGDPRLPPHVRGGMDNPRQWVRCVQNGGTTIPVFRDFVDHICSDIEQNPVQHNNIDTDDIRILLWDNLNSHHAAYVHQTVQGRPGPC